MTIFIGASKRKTPAPVKEIPTEDSALEEVRSVGADRSEEAGCVVQWDRFAARHARLTVRGNVDR